ncbi:phenylacetate--CoA ligase family protein [Allochromatium palmeri]|uniref:Phenylacetate--CoA ligase family protein n=1 Tax=Allochromatium palmeri TaxID=231048 RepID=A0A6N8EA78_9GAMM|nr:phenylacetate--CoA ligase family protein [Allochromatium palmeri]MTW21193.1 hypothetical protein [Allochromatium palmeri]
MHPLFHRSMISIAAPRRVQLMRMIQGRIGWNASQVREFQEQRLRETIRYCWDFVPYYREKWQGYLSRPEDITCIADLERLPILTKDEYRSNRNLLEAAAPNLKCSEGRTGGSTGKPILYQTCHEDEETAWGQMYTGWSWAGYRLGDPFLVIGGESIGVGLSDRRTKKDRVMNRWVTSGSNITLERVRHFSTSPIFKKIRFIYGYPNSIREYGEQLHRLGIRFPYLRGIVCTAEVMTDETRSRIHECFGAEVRILDQWGMFDGGIQGCESIEHNGLHVHFHSGMLEIVDDDGKQISEPNKVGRGLATSFTNTCTPFVRYDTGDMVHWLEDTPYASGVRWPRIGPVDGRTGDVIYLPSGRSIPMPGLTLVMRWIDDLYQYQFIQTGPQAVEARLNPGPGFAMSKDEIERFLRARISDEIDWTIALGPPQLTPNGKLLIIRNDWKRNQGCA